MSLSNRKIEERRFDDLTFHPPPNHHFPFSLVGPVYLVNTRETRARFPL